ncbi:MAG: ester cyclase, partial [Phototrophicaceae bacterium]
MRRSIVLIMMLFIVFVLSSIVSVAQDDMAQANKNKIQIAIADYNAGNRDAIYDLLTEPVMMNAGDNVLYETSKAENVEWDIALDAAMPDRQMNADILIAQGDWVAMHVTYTGTFTEPYSFIAFGPDAFEPTNAVITWTETDFLHFNTDGLIDEVWVVSDPAPLFEQLGIFPSMDEEDPATPLDQPAGYQTLSADELATTYSTGMEERNSSLAQ